MVTQRSTAGDRNGPALSICIPTYNRVKMVVGLVRALAAMPGEFEIRVHDDGSTDGTLKALSNIDDPRVHVTSGANRGRALALASATAAASGTFTMLFDDDDELWPDGLRQVLADCAEPLPDGVAGYIYHMADEAGARIGDAFPVARSNFLALRNDWRVHGDKKEVVRTDLLRPVIERATGTERRVPTSLYWATLALDSDVLCSDFVIGRKDYHEDGMSDRIRSLKRANPGPLAALYRTHLRGFAKGRFRSPKAAARALAALAFHRANAAFRRRARRP